MPDSESVKLWRDTFRLNLSVSWKADVDKTVTDITLWRELLASWFWIDAKGKKHRKAPGIKNLLTEYERLSFQRDEDRKRREALRERHQQRIPARSHSPMFTMRRAANSWKG